VKKDKSRFTLRFCGISPKHVVATEVLIAAGRRKASLVADLIDEHIKKHGDNAFADYIGNDAYNPVAESKKRFLIEKSGPTVTKEKMQTKTSAGSLLKTQAETLPSQLAEEQPSEEMRNSILEGLSMFKM